MAREMKDSGVKWIGTIPTSWNIQKVKTAFYRSKEEAHIEDPVILSLARSGVKIRDISNNEGQLAESYYNYNPVVEGDLLLNPMDLYSGANCSISKVSGVISPAYINLRTRGNYCPAFYDYYFKTQYWAMALFAHGKGVSFDNRWTLSPNDLFNYYIPVPDVDEQKRIADFLDRTCAEIDTVIEKTKATIEEYKKLKQSVITEAVTKGIRGDRPMKDSGVDWIGKFPAEWTFAELKMFCKVNNGKEIANEVDKETEGAISVYGSGGVFKYTDNYMFDGKTVMFGRKGTLGKPLYVTGKVWVVDTMYYLTYSPNLIPKFNYYQLWAFDWVPHITQTALPSIVASQIVACKFAIPSLQEQQEIIDFLDRKCAEIDKLIADKTHLLEEMEIYKKSVIFEYVTGKKEIV